MSLLEKIRNKIETSLPVKFIIQKSKNNSLPGFKGVSLYDVVVFFFGQIKKIGMTERASAISFNLVMAIPPAIIFLFTLLPFLPVSKSFQQGLYELIQDVIPGEKDHANLIHFLQDFINKPRTGLLSLGFVLSMFFSSNAMMGIQRSFDKGYLGFIKRKGLQKRGVALKLTFVLYILVFASVLLLVARGQVLDFFGIENKTVIAIITNTRWLVIILLFFACISFIYRYAPAVDKKWPIINPGSILATILMIATTFGFSWWVGRFGHYNQFYGSISTIIIMMAMIFVNSLVLLIGFELNVSINAQHQINTEKVEPVSIDQK